MNTKQDSRGAEGGEGYGDGAARGVIGKRECPNLVGEFRRRNKSEKNVERKSRVR